MVMSLKSPRQPAEDDLKFRRAKADGDLRRIFRQRMPQFHWTVVETGFVAPGVPDTNACRDGVEFWIEFKRTATRRIAFREFQPAWIHTRIRHGGRVWIAVRQTHQGGARLGPPIDGLWLVYGDVVLDLAASGLLQGLESGRWTNGPAKWD